MSLDRIRNSYRSGEKKEKKPKKTRKKKRSNSALSKTQTKVHFPPNVDTNIETNVDANVDARLIKSAPIPIPKKRLFGISNEGLNLPDNPWDLIKRILNGHDIYIIFAADWIGKPKFNWEQLSVLLKYAIQKGLIEVLQLLVDRYEINVNETLHPLEEATTCLVLAVTFGHTGCVKYLLDQGANQESPDAHSLLPVHHAIINDHQAVLTQLFVNNANCLRWNNAEGDSSFTIAIQYGRLSVLKWLLTQTEGYKDQFFYDQIQLIVAAIKHDQVEILNYLVDVFHYDLKKISCHGYSVMFVALITGSRNVINCLQEKKFSINETNKNGDTFAHFAAAKGATETLTLLAELGFKESDFAKKNEKKETPLFLAIRHNQTHVAEFLFSCHLSFSAIEAKELINDIDENMFKLLMNYLSGNQRERASFILAYIKINPKIKNDVDTFYQENIERTFGNPKCSDFLFEYELIDRLAAFQFYFNFLLKIGFDEHAVQFCQGIIKRNKDKASVNWARFNLAQQIFLRFRLVEENSPLEKDDRFLTDNNYLIVRAIQAFFFLEECDPLDEQGVHLAKSIGKELSLHPDKEEISVNNWKPQAIVCYLAYVVFKKNHSLGGRDDFLEFLYKAIEPREKISRYPDQRHPAPAFAGVNSSGDPYTQRTRVKRSSTFFQAPSPNLDLRFSKDSPSPNLDLRFSKRARAFLNEKYEFNFVTRTPDSIIITFSFHINNKAYQDDVLTELSEHITDSLKSNNIEANMQIDNDGLQVNGLNDQQQTALTSLLRRHNFNECKPSLTASPLRRSSN